MEFAICQIFPDTVTFQVCGWWVECGSSDYTIIALVQGMHVYKGGAAYLLCSTGWQQFDIILFVARDTAGEKYDISLSVVVHESNKILDLVQLEHMFWEVPSVPMLPCCQA